MTKPLIWTAEMHKFCRDRPHLTRRQLAKEFAQHFGEQRTKSTLSQFCRENGYRSLHNGRFKKGNRPHNAGVRGFNPPGSERTQYKPGNRPHNGLPTGARIKRKPTFKKNGELKTPAYWKVKVGEPNQWEPEHRLCWERRRGPIPKGCVVVFVDGDVDNLSINNLELLSRSELVFLNRHYGGLVTGEPELNRTRILLARVRAAASKRKRKDVQQAVQNQGIA